MQVAYLEGCTAAYMLLRLERCTERLERHTGVPPATASPLSLPAGSGMPAAAVGQLEKLVEAIEAY